MSTPTTLLEKLAAIRDYALRQVALADPDAPETQDVSQWRQVAHFAKADA